MRLNKEEEEETPIRTQEFPTVYGRMDGQERFIVLISSDASKKNAAKWNEQQQLYCRMAIKVVID